MNKHNYENIKQTVRRLESILQIVTLAVVYYLVWRYSYPTVERVERPYSGFFPTYYGNGKYVLMFIYAFLSVILFHLTECFQYGHQKLSHIFVSQVISVIIINVITYFQLSLIANVLISFVPILILTGADIILCLLFCILFTVIYHHMYVPKNMVMIYGHDDAVTLKFKMDTRSDKYKVTKVLPSTLDNEILFKEMLSHDAVIINDIPAERRNDILKFCYGNSIRTYVIPKITDIIIRGADDVTLFDTPLFLVKGMALSPTEAFTKRAFDIVLSLIALIIASPFMLITALAIKLEDHGPVFFKQERVTIHGKRFNILKFRSMIVDAEKSGMSIPATGKDPRITKVGRIIRATRFDELPQILNILAGQMSWVGPRPERTEHVIKYTEEIPEFAFRQKVKGGLTGYAQIYGKYNTSAYDKLRLDLIYIEDYSLILDLKLLLMTIRIIFSKESTEGFEMQEELERKKQELLAGQEIRELLP